MPPRRIHRLQIVSATAQQLADVSDGDADAAHDALDRALTDRAMQRTAPLKRMDSFTQDTVRERIIAFQRQSNPDYGRETRHTRRRDQRRARQRRYGRPRPGE